MSNRRRLERERLEIYLVHLLLAYRRLIFIIAMPLLAYAITFLFVKPIFGYIGLLPALYLILLSSSYTTVLYTARFGAWIATLGRQED